MGRGEDATSVGAGRRAEPAGLVDAAVEGGPLDEWPSQRGHDRPEGFGVHGLAVGGAGRSGDVLVHEGPPEIVHAGPQQLASATDVPA